MKLICYTTSNTIPEIRPAPATREWMDNTPESYAYRCLPLNIANSHGWEVLSPANFRVRWSGGGQKEDIRITSDDDSALAPVSHFGSGVLTFHIEGLFRTEPGTNLFVTGPINNPKDGIVGLSGIIETDWSPYTFTMNWQFTRPGARATFKKGEPFCTLFPIGRDAIEKVEPEFRKISSDPELSKDYHDWNASRQEFIKDLGTEYSEARKEKWQKKYYRGLCPHGGEGTKDHQTKLRLKEFVDKRD